MRDSRFPLVMITAGFLVLAWGKTVAFGTPVQFPKSQTARALCSAIVRSLLEHRDQQPGPERAYFVTVKGRDPDPAFFAAFSHSSIAVRPGTQYVQGKGTLLSINDLQRESPSRAIVHGATQDSGCSVSQTWILVRGHSRWRVKGVFAGGPCTSPSHDPATPRVHPIRQNAGGGVTRWSLGRLFKS